MNKRVPEFMHEAKCLELLEQLRKRLSGRRTAKNGAQEAIVLRTSIDGFTGYGLHAQQIIKDFAALGCRPRVIPIRIEEPLSVPIPQSIKEHFTDYSNGKWELLLHPPGVPPTEGKKTIYFTMWESTRLSAHHLENLKKASVIIVPCEWNANTFSAQGVEAPIVI